MANGGVSRVGGLCCLDLRINWVSACPMVSAAPSMNEGRYGCGGSTVIGRELKHDLVQVLYVTR